MTAEGYRVARAVREVACQPDGGSGAPLLGSPLLHQVDRVSQDRGRPGGAVVDLSEKVYLICHQLLLDGGE
jgi:hypothetical protein